MKTRILIFLLTIVFLLCLHNVGLSDLRVATFEVDASPPLGSPVAYAPAREITDPLSARGIVLLGAGKPIVLCAVDFLGIGNQGYDQWRQQLATAADTTASRVAVHTLHQHDGPRCDFDVEQVLAEHGMAGERFDVVFCRDLIARTAAAIGQSIRDDAHRITHVGIGKGKVDGVASNRRLLGTDGKVEIVRFSKSTDSKAINAPVGVIDPWVRIVSFWNDQSAVAALTYYATHPQSYYGQGDVTCEFVGLARNQQQRNTNTPHIHFNGASGNVAAGKYNDGSKRMRPILANRLARGMQAAWDATERFAVSSDDIDWRVEPIALPAASYLDRETIQSVLNDPQADSRTKLMAAKELVWLARVSSGDKVELSCLRIGNAYLLHLPGELFVEYQLSAQAMIPDSFVATAAYGDYSPGYIGTAISYSQAGYEVRQGVSRVSEEAEQLLIDGIQRLIVGSDDRSPGDDLPTSRITIDGQFDDWSDLPSYFDPLYDTHDTDHSLLNDEPTYVDHPDADLIEYKATNDDENLYFYFRSRGEIGRTQTADGQQRAGRYYAIVTIDVDRDKSTGYNLHEGGYYPTSDGYDVNAEIEFYDGTENTAHYLHQAIDNEETLTASFREQSRNAYTQDRDGPYPAGTITLRHGQYEYYTQWVYHDDDQITFVRDKGPVVKGIAHAKTSANGSELEAVFPLKGFLTTKNGQPLISPGQVVDLSFSLEASGESAPDKRWASDTAVPIKGFRLRSSEHTQ